MELAGVLEACLYAPDLRAAENFYALVLKLQVLGRVDGRHVFFRCGHGVFLIFNPQHTGTIPTLVNGKPIPLHGATGPGHVAFGVSSEAMDGWHRWLEQQAVPIEAEVHWPGGGRSLYFRDPAGNSVELATPEVWGLGESSATAPRG